MSEFFEQIQSTSTKRLNELRTELSAMDIDGLLGGQICIYACGSLGRLEMAAQSDLDLFFISGVDLSEKEDPVPFTNVGKYRFFSQLYDMNKKLHYKDPSGGGRYWEFISKKNLLDIGSREEDYNNSFTARMLLLLESKSLYNDNAYLSLIDSTVEKYFVDYPDNSDGFFPLYLMNDILRYWYTLTLNYEWRRDDSDDANKRYWKRLKLKYARLITCYSMLACLYKKAITPDIVKKYVLMTPFERLESLANDNHQLSEFVSEIASEYNWYLELRTRGPELWNDPNKKAEAMNHADKFHDLLVHRLMGSVSKGNAALRLKADTY